MRSIARAKLLILDDWGPEALTPEQARDLLEIIEDRYDKGSLIITSQVPVDRWHDMIGIPTLADAILDRVIHNAYRIDLTGESLRKHAFVRLEIQALLTNPDTAKHHQPRPAAANCQVAGIKSERWPASDRNRWPASYWNAWPASSEIAVRRISS